MPVTAIIRSIRGNINSLLEKGSRRKRKKR
jgi:hypothetical protein